MVWVYYGEESSWVSDKKSPGLRMIQRDLHNGYSLETVEDLSYGDHIVVMEKTQNSIDLPFGHG